MLIIETNYGNFGSFKDIFKFMTYEKKETITIQSASYCCGTFMKMPLECTKKEIEAACA
ncbi:MAG: hypothetical protein RSB44_09775 [Carnobacterium sp.]